MRLTLPQPELQPHKLVEDTKVNKYKNTDILRSSISVYEYKNDLLPALRLGGLNWNGTKLPVWLLSMPSIKLCTGPNNAIHISSYDHAHVHTH